MQDEIAVGDAVKRVDQAKKVAIDVVKLKKDDKG